MIPTDILAEHKQKYEGCWVKLKHAASSKAVCAHLSVVDTGGTYHFSVDATNGLVVPYGDPNYIIDFKPPETGLVYVPVLKDTYLIQRSAEKQYKRGFCSSNYLVRPLINIAIRAALIKSTQIALNKNAFRKDANEFFKSFQVVDKVFNRHYPSLDKAVGFGTPVALSSKLAIVPSSKVNFDYDLFREVYNIGSISVKQKTIYVCSHFKQEVIDYIRRSNLDWSVCDETQ